MLNGPCSRLTLYDPDDTRAGPSGSEENQRYHWPLTQVRTQDSLRLPTSPRVKGTGVAASVLHPREMDGSR